ncbi:MAG TPA: LacI family DNA-binding transcriptional regulator [Micromonosporaceae bacterium]|jgi:LacI family transcriptional regulator
MSGDSWGPDPQAPGQRRQRASTIAEVARHASVSPATVSRVMNGRFVGDPEVADRVRKAATDLNYAPSPVARSLALGQTHTVAFVVPDIGNPTFQAMLSNLSKSAAADGYRVLVADSSEDPAEEALLAVGTRRGCDGLVLCAPRMSDEQLSLLLPALRPVLLINRSSPRFDAPSISVDYDMGIQHLAEHLYALGHRHFVYLEGPEPSSSNRSRLDGLAAFAGRVTDLVIDRIPAGSASADGYERAAAVRQSGATAALAYNDLVAVGLMSALAEQGVSVPQDISVAGFDDIPLVRYVTPRLTTVSVPYGPLGAQAWKGLHALIKGEMPSHNVVFQPRLQPRDSTAPARDRHAICGP